MNDDDFWQREAECRGNVALRFKRERDDLRKDAMRTLAAVLDAAGGRVEINTARALTLEDATIVMHKSFSGVVYEVKP